MAFSQENDGGIVIHGRSKPLPYRYYIRKTTKPVGVGASTTLFLTKSPPITLFLLTHKAQKKKLCKKKTPLKRISLVATSDQGSAFGNRKLFKKSLSKNFKWGAVLVLTLPFIKVFCFFFSKKKRKILTPTNSYFSSAYLINLARISAALPRVSFSRGETPVSVASRTPISTIA